MSASLWTHIGYARLAGVIGERAGLHFAPNRQPAAEAAMKRVMREARIDGPVDFARTVAADTELMATMLAAVTIGETYFFREKAQLQYIREHVLPVFRRSRTPERPLNAWSAGCATGEEPYTLAIMLREAGLANSSSVLATDVSRPRLEAARRARYTRWSLRGMPEEDVDRYFLRRGSQFLLRPQLRAVVDFRELNLASDGWPGGASGIGEMSLILCRNVLIYFEREMVTEVASRLLASLSEDGWLFMGASDPMLSDLVPCETVVTGAGLAYRRGVARPHWTVISTVAPSQPGATIEQSLPTTVTGTWAADTPEVERAGEPSASLIQPPRSRQARADAPAAPATQPRTGDADILDGTPADVDSVAGIASAMSTDTLHAMSLYANRDYAAAAAAAIAIVSRTPADEQGWIVLIRALANSGRTVEAEQSCTRALERHPLSAELTHLHGVLLAQRGEFAAAAAAARRALYVDRTLAAAHLALGRAMARLGHRAQAERAFLAAEQLLARMDQDAPVPLTDGESAHRLLEAARAQRLLLGEVVA